jgi:hypothetical protein
VADAPNWTSDNEKEIYKIGVFHQHLKPRVERGFRHMLGQMYGVVGRGLIMTEHVFRGLKRGMLVAGDEQADIKKLAFTCLYGR